jgi:hypothetical protein
LAVTVRQQPRFDRAHTWLRLPAAAVITTALAACGSAAPPPSSTDAASAGVPTARATVGSSTSPTSPPTAASANPTKGTLADWSTDELYLAAGIPDEIRDACEPTRPAELADAAAQLTCHPDEALVSSMGYYLFREDGDARKVYAERLAEYDVELNSLAGSNDCENGTPSESAELPAADDVSAPRMGCFVNEFGVANLRLLTPPSVYIGVLGTSGDIAALDDWARGGQATLGAIPRPAVLWNAPEPTI